MRILNGNIILSPSDLIRFQGCEHATALDLRLLKGEPLAPAPDSAEAVLLQRRGQEHEQRYLSEFDDTSAEVVVIDQATVFEDAARLTREAMMDGARVIYQGALRFGTWQGYSDFLERVEEPSSLGPFGYEAIDTKLKRRVDPKHAIQLGLYSRGVAEIQGRTPTQAHVVLGTAPPSRVPLVVEDLRHYTDRLAARLEAFVADPWPTAPEPVAACGQCRWREHCNHHWESTDSLTLVAGITRLQRRRLKAAGVTTLAHLASCERHVPRVQPDTLEKLRSQARLQHNRRAGGEQEYELKPIQPGRGLARLPQPSRADLFFDMEGDPLIGDGVEYLFGVYHEPCGAPTFRTWWAHDPVQEKAAVLAVLEFFIAHLTRHRDAFIYHYAPYEVTALKRLTARYCVGEIELDHLLRTERFVDLYRVVQQGIIASEPSYSLKDLEVFYMPKRQGEVLSATDSIIAYENWLETGDDTILDDIARYNEEDCRSTKLLRDWLVTEVRPASLAWFEPDNVEVPPVEADAEQDALQALIAGAERRLGSRLAELLFELNGFHRRADKPVWWEFFDRQERETDDLIDDLESLGGLRAARSPVGQEREYLYPPQETKLRAGSRVAVRGASGTAEITNFYRQRRRVTVKFPRKIGTPNTCDLIPSGPFKNQVLRDAVRRITESMVAGDDRYRAVADFLERRAPRLCGRTGGSPIVGKGDLVEEVITAVANLDRTCLPIQGPPGTGKTYVSAAAIVDLVNRGHRIAVSSHSHKAIDNLLVAVAQRARDQGQEVSIIKKQGTRDEAPDDPAIDTTRENHDPALLTADVVGGTAWLFARPEFDQTFDYVFIDEAGQVAVANLMAIGSAAKNIVLVGDHMQLSQPVQGVHPGESGLSTLEYMLEGHQTVPADRGVFLPVSRRMHPSICELVSRLVYEDRLTSDEGASRHRIDFAADPFGLPARGVCFFDVEHTGNSQSSEEEAEKLKEVYLSLLDASFTDRDGCTRMMEVADILVVSPYNAQVNLLTEMLPAGARVGTVDRFQGQEAPACLISMATSSGEELPRSVDFLFSLNRLNVAISRAQALAVLFASPRLLDVACSTIEELKLVNALCGVRDYAKRNMAR